MEANHTTVKLTTRIGKATAKKASRYAITGVQVEPAGKHNVRLIATDGRILAIVRADGDTDKPRNIPQAVIPTKKTGGRIVGNGQWQNSDGKFAAEDSEQVNFPDYRSVIPDIADYDVSFAIDAQLLLNLAQAIGGHDGAAAKTDTVVHIAIKTNDKHTSNKPLLVVGQGIGVIMPVNMQLGSRSSVGEEFEDRKNEILSDD